MSIRDIIRTIDGYDDSIKHVMVNNNCFMLESSIDRFMEENSIESRDVVLHHLESIQNLKNIKLIDEEDLNEAYVYLTLMEALDAKEITNFSRLGNSLDMMFHKAISKITLNKFNNEEEIDLKIKKCDSLLDQLRDELKKIDSNSKDVSRYKFYTVFIIRIIKTTFKMIIFPLVGNTLDKEYKGALGVLNAGQLVLSTVLNFSEIVQMTINYRKFIMKYVTYIENVKSTLISMKKNFNKGEDGK